MEGTFNNVKTATIAKAQVELNVEPTVTNWIIKMLGSRIIISEMGYNKVKRRATSSTPQGVISPRLGRRQHLLKNENVVQSKIDLT